MRNGVRHLKAPNVRATAFVSPFRYPGGKTWFVPFFERYVYWRGGKLRHVIEPFAGGAIVSLTAAMQGWATKVTLAELDSNVAAVWFTILRGHGRWLAEEVKQFRFSSKAAKLVLDSERRSPRQRAFATILKNRIQRGGILAPGAGILNRGERDNGVGSRWYPETLSKRILEIVSCKRKIQFISGDGLALMRRNSRSKTVTYFIDPPYANAGKRLYACSEVEARDVFEVASRLKGDPIITYEDSDEIRELCAEFEFDFRTVVMKNTHHARRRELIIGRDLAWVDLQVPREVKPARRPSKK